MKVCGAVLLALVLFFTVAFPAVVEAHWASWGPVYVRLIWDSCHRIAPSQRIVQFGTQLYSSAVEISVFPECTGINIIRLYSILFGVVMLFDRKSGQRSASLMLYAGGLCTLWAASFCRGVLKAIGYYGPSGIKVPFVLAIFLLVAWLAVRPRRTESPATSGTTA